MATAPKNLTLSIDLNAPLPSTIGAMTDQLYVLREERRRFEAISNEIEAKYAEIETLLLAKLEAEGSDKGGGKHATCSVSESVVGNVTDWGRFNAWVKKTGNFHLYQRRLSAPAVREVFALKGAIPGVEPFTKRTLNLRST